jgi:hypothetical protein
LSQAFWHEGEGDDFESPSTHRQIVPGKVEGILLRAQSWKVVAGILDVLLDTRGCQVNSVHVRFFNVLEDCCHVEKRPFGMTWVFEINILFITVILKKKKQFSLRLYSPYKSFSILVENHR